MSDWNKEEREPGSTITIDQIVAIERILQFMKLMSHFDEDFMFSLKSKYKRYGDKMMVSNKQSHMLSKIYSRFSAAYGDTLPPLTVKSEIKYVDDNVSF